MSRRGPNWKPPIVGRKVRIIHPNHLRYGLVGVISAGFNADNGACWVRITGQSFESVVRPWEWEFIDGGPSDARFTKAAPKRHPLNARQVELLAALGENPRTGRELVPLLGMTMDNFRADIKKLSQRQLAGRKGRAGWVRT
jgi:hypothetical protein